MNLHEPTLFAALRKAPFRGRMNQGQVDGVKLILAACAQDRVTDVRQVAYSLATAHHETGGTLKPVRETFAKSDKAAIANLEKAHKSGKLKVSKPYWRDGFFGRGLVQLTWETNYARMGKLLGVDLVGKPSLALDPLISARVLVVGMRDGVFTGKKLADYFSATKDDPTNARRIVNGTDKAALIAGYHKQFLAALLAAQAVPVPTPRPQTPTQRLEPAAVPAPPAAPPASSSWASRILIGLGLAPKPAPAAPPAERTAPATETVRRVQSQLQALGYAEVGLADGLAGPKLNAAIKAFAADQKPPLKTDGEIDDTILAALPKAAKRPVAAARANATIKDLRQAGSEEAQAFNVLGWLAKAALGGGALGGLDASGALNSIKETADTAMSTFSTLQTILVTIIGAIQWSISHWWLFAILGGLWMLYKVTSAALDLIIKFRVGILQRASTAVAPPV